MELSLAPIQGVTNAFQRNTYARLFKGMDSFYAPFIATSPMRKKTSPLFKDILPASNQCPKLIPQLLGNDGADFRFFAKVIADMGYDEINWNIGCPFPMLTKKKRGSGILPYPSLIDAFLDEVCIDNHYKLTIKLRLGMESFEEGLEVIDVINQYPIHQVILHGRTGIQKYKGVVDLEAFTALKEQCKHTMTYNGDIFTKEDFQKISNRFPDIPKYMLGRGALRDPFLAASIKGIPYTPQEKQILFKAYHDAIYDFYTSDIVDLHIIYSKMKEFWVYAAHSLKDTDAFLSRIRQTRTPADYDKATEELFGSQLFDGL